MIHIDIYMIKQRGEAAEHITEPAEIFTVTGFKAAEPPELPGNILTEAENYSPSQLSGERPPCPS